MIVLSVYVRVGCKDKTFLMKSKISRVYLRFLTGRGGAGAGMESCIG